MASSALNRACTVKLTIAAAYVRRTEAGAVRRHTPATAFQVTTARVRRKLLMAGAQPMPSDGEEIVDDPVDGQEALGLGSRLESPHVSFTPARGLM